MYQVQHPLNYVFSDRKRYNLKHKPIAKQHVISKLEKTENVSLPSKVDLREYVKQIYNQGTIGSCVAHSMAASINIDSNIKDMSANKLFNYATQDIAPSRLYIYWHARSVGSFPVTQDTGSTIHDGSMAMQKYRTCPESMWTYDVTKFTQQPDLDCYKVADSYPGIKIQQIDQDVDHIKQALNAKLPVAFGVVVHQSFMSADAARTGNIPIPGNNDQVMGGHAICMVGYDDSKKCFIFQNSWGPEWGDKGYGYIPYAYILNQQESGDFWTITFA